MIALPKVVGRETGEEVGLTLEIAADHPAFQGHFPDNPILPGVIQVDWAIRLGTEAFGPLGEFQGMANLKFMDLIRPGGRIELGLTFDREAGRLGFRYHCQGCRKSAGQILFARDCPASAPGSSPQVLP